MITTPGPDTAVTVRSALVGARAAARARSRLRPSAAFRQGLISDLGNPKIAVFFASLLPQFAPPGPAAFGVLLLLGVTFAALTLGWLTLYTVLVARAGEVLHRPRLRRAIEGAAGAILVGLGLRVALE
jgi:threonine/homoserine/homoserine lactone efflux protein